MAISVSCPECDATYKVADNSLGKKMRCKSCNAVFPVKEVEDIPEAEDMDEARVRPGSPHKKPTRARRPAEDVDDEDDNAPKRRRRVDDDDDDEPRPRKRRPPQKASSSAGIGLIIGLAAVAVVVLLLCVGGGALLFWGAREPARDPGPNNAMAQMPPIANVQPEFKNVGPGVDAAPLPFVPPPAKLPDPVRTAAWEVEFDPRPAVKPLPLASFALKAKANEIHGIHFSNPTGQIVVVHAEEVKGQPKRKLKIDLHENNGTYLKTIELYQAQVHGHPTEQLAALTPDGTKLLVRNTEQRSRVELWDLTDGKKVSEATPHGGGEVTDLFVIDAQRVLSGSRGQVNLWNLADAKLIYTLSGYRGIVQVSPNKRFIVVCNGITVDMLDSATGKRKGQLVVPGHGPVTQLDSAAFSHDGKELAAVVQTSLGKRMVRWNLKAGDAIDAFPSSADQRPMRWIDQRFVVHDNPMFRQSFLIDWKMKGTLMNYTLINGQALVAPPDDRFWYYYEAKGSTFVAAVSLPDGQAQALADQVSAGQVQPAIPPGSLVRLQIETNDASYRDEVNQVFNETAANRGFRVGAGGFVVKVRANGQRTGRTIPLRIMRMGFGPGAGMQNITIQDYKVEGDVQILDPQGAVMHTQKNTHGLPFILNFKTEEYQREVEENIWNSAKNSARQSVLPTTLFRVGGQLQTLPRIAFIRADP